MVIAALRRREPSFTQTTLVPDSLDRTLMQR
jgi:hypothetical protein